MRIKTCILVLASLVPGVASAAYEFDCKPKSAEASFTLKGVFGTDSSKPNFGNVSNFSVSDKFKNLTGCPSPKISQFELQLIDSGKFLVHHFEYSKGCELHIVLPSGSYEGSVWLEKTNHTLLPKSQQEFESYRAETLVSECTVTKIEESPNQSLNIETAQKSISN